MWRVLFYIVLLCMASAGNESRLVRTSQGPVRGYKDPEHDIYVFYSIPYATAPTGVNRFKAPESAPTWIEPFEAVDKGIVCYQNNLKQFKDKKVMAENCLIATIHVPNTNETNLPVYVYVHGGGNYIGFGDSLTPKKMVSSQKIIGVTFNYRLGPHGFLCLGTEDVPGNAGMKDQVALLRWVKENIVNFGGNPHDVTIGGGSAGSSDVELLMLSKMTDGLFNKVISESGASSAVYNIQCDPIENAKLYAKFLQFNNTNDLKALEEQFKSISYENLFSNKIINLTSSHFLMVPCVESDKGQEIFLEDDPVSILKSGNYKKLPMLYGFTNMEGLLRIKYFENWKEHMSEKFSDFLPADLTFDNNTEKEFVANNIKNFYFHKDIIDSQDIFAYIDYFTDVFFTYSMLNNVKLQVAAGNNRIYLYEFVYVENSIPVGPSLEVRGAPHCAQSAAVMDDSEFEYNSMYTEKSEGTREMYRGIWLNFISTGKPVLEVSDLPHWPAVGADCSPHMLLNETMELRGSLLKERLRFWENIYNHHYRRPVPPMFTNINWSR